eukprot:1338170-Rhodomonas_salina.1
MLENLNCSPTVFSKSEELFWVDLPVGRPGSKLCKEGGSSPRDGGEGRAQNVAVGCGIWLVRNLRPGHIKSDMWSGSGCAETKALYVEWLRGDSAVRPHGGSRYSGTASASVRA